jgi:hypothetical protein
LYTLSFWLSKNTNHDGVANVEKKMFVWIGETQYDANSFDITTGQYAEHFGTNIWKQYTLEYLATSETTFVTFVAFGSLDSSWWGPALDAIELVALNCVADVAV